MFRNGFAAGAGFGIALLLTAIVYAAAAYPTGVASLPVRTDGQTITAAWFNTIHDEIVAIENGLVNGLAHDLKFTDATYDIGKSGATRPRDGFFSRNLVIGGTFTPAGVITAAGQLRASGYMDAVQSVNDSTDTYLTLNQEDYDVGTMHDLVTNNTRITIPSGGDGLYLIVGGTTFAADADGQRELFLRKNGTTKVARVQAMNLGAGASVGLQVTQVLALVATDYIELGCSHAAGAALNVGSATRAQSTHLQLVKLW